MKLNKKLIYSVVLVCLLVLSFSILAFLKSGEIKQVCFSEKCVEVEIVNTPETRQKGLMFRESLGENEGMLFIFEEEGLYPFWMKNTLIPLDIIWISQDMQIVDIKTAVPCNEDPCPNYSPSGKALYVLEVNAGFAERKGIEIGDEVNFQMP